MARVLICEPHDDIRALLELVVRRLGHEPVPYCGNEANAVSVDAALVEPGEPDGMRLARRLRGLDVPVLFTSIFPPTAETLALAPAAYLLKPFPLHVLERALAATLDTQAVSQDSAAV